MKFDLSNRSDLNNFNYKVKYCIENKKKVNLTVPRETRTSKQNAALHKYFEFVSEELNELGLEFQYFGVTGKQLSMRYNENIVKDYFWRPIQRTLFNIESTTKLNTEQMNEIIDVITKFFADKGVSISFPSIDKD